MTQAFPHTNLSGGFFVCPPAFINEAGGRAFEISLVARSGDLAAHARQ